MYRPGLQLALYLVGCCLSLCCNGALATGLAVFNVKDYGATGVRTDDALPGIQKAIDTCAAAGGGTVYVPPGEYTSGQIMLRSHVRFHVEAGATIFASLKGTSYKKDQYAALIYGEDLENITIEGRGTLDGQSEYEWRLDDLDDAYIRSNSLIMKALGKPLMRPFPKGYPTETVFPRMMLLLRCKDVRISGLTFIHSRSWNIHPYACERLVIDGIYVHSSLKEGVWADGIDPDGCKDLRISNSTIETGDDALVFYSSDAYGPPKICENITVTNCRLSSASSALKFVDGNLTAIRNVVVDNCLITSSNRGIAFMVFNKGYVSDVLISNVTIETTAFDWFWWGEADPIHFNIKRLSEVDTRRSKAQDPPIGAIRHVVLRNIMARGKGTSSIHGHPERSLEDVTFDNVKIFMSADPQWPLQKAVQAISVRWAKDVKLKDVEVVWDKPDSEKWQNALHLQDIKGLELVGFRGSSVKTESVSPLIVLDQVQDAMIKDAKLRAGTQVFMDLRGEQTRNIVLTDNDLRNAKIPYQINKSVRSSEVKAIDNFISESQTSARSAKSNR